MGEFERIDLFLKAFRDAGGRTAGPGIPLGPGDDCAVITPPGPVAITTDAVVEDVHFRRAWTSPPQLGHKALAVNLSDLAAMGARPFAFTCAFGLPPDIDNAYLAGVATGMGPLATRFDLALVGGNFTRARELSITITATGVVERPLLRSGARVGDLVWLVGTVGLAAAELQALDAGIALTDVRSALREPEPLVDAALRWVAAGACCAIDVSDGLVQDLGHIAKASGVGIRIDVAKLPGSQRFSALGGTTQQQLTGGEDYALVVCAPPAMTGEGTVIGEVTQGRGVKVIGADGLSLAGHDHFA